MLKFKSINLNMNNPLVVILGPTASGKTSFAVKLADKTNSEIISADSRQIYKGMDIGTGKDLSEYRIEDKYIPYHLIDILNPNEDYSVYQFKQDFFQCFNVLQDQKKNIILCGGTGLYIESILLNYDIPNIGPDIKLRNMLGKLTKKELIEQLKKIDNSKFNPKFHTTNRRIIRTIEINKNKKNRKKILNKNFHIPHYQVFGLKIKRECLLSLIDDRLNIRFNDGMIEEVEKLIYHGMSLERLKYFGLEYKIVGEYLFNQIDFDDMKLKLKFAINRFSKRQMTFFRRMEKRGINIEWIDKKEYQNIDQFIKKYSL